MEEPKLELLIDEYLPLRDVVFNTLRQGILKGELKPGERLMEIHLANRLGVSRTPIREAIRMLELEGLVTMIPRKGAEVARISKQAEEEKQMLSRTEDDFEKAITTRDATTIAEADVKFHDVILKASKNGRLVQMVNNLAERVYRYRLEYIKDSRNHQRLIEEHRKIMEYIGAGDAENARNAIETHIDNQEKNIISQLEL